MMSKHTRELLLPNECMDLVKMYAKKGGYNQMCLTAMQFQTSAAEAISIATLYLSLSLSRLPIHTLAVFKLRQPKL